MPAQVTNRLAELRAARGVRLLEVAAAADRDISVLRRYEAGLTAIPDEVKARLAVYFGVTRAYLMGWDEDETSTPEESVA